MPKPVVPLISVAPMMAWTDRHCRYFHRLLSPHVRLYTEMITAGALIHGDAKRLLAFNADEHPVAVQLGGCDPKELSICAEIIESYGYDEINLNIGCPSDRVQRGRIGACLMADPHCVADCVAAMQAKVKVPVTVKCRLGIDDQDSYEFLATFIDRVRQAGCQEFIIHARKAWLRGLSPKENREKPPLHYDRVYAIKRDFPMLKIIINGGIKSVSAIKQHLQHVDGVMIGREAYQNPAFLMAIDKAFYDGGSDADVDLAKGIDIDIEKSVNFVNPEHLKDLENLEDPECSEYSKYNITHANRVAIVERLIPYMEQQLSLGVPLAQITRHILGLFRGLPGGKRWRRYLSEQSHARVHECSQDHGHKQSNGPSCSYGHGYGYGNRYDDYHDNNGVGITGINVVLRALEIIQPLNTSGKFLRNNNR